MDVLFSDSVFINEPQDIIISSSQNNVSTCGFLDGSIDITTTGGTSPYTFKLE